MVEFKTAFITGSTGLLGNNLVRLLLISLGTIRLLKAEEDRTHFDPAKSQRELGLTFRPVEETLRDVLQDLTVRGLNPLPA